MMCHKPSKKRLLYLSTNNILVILGFERQLIRRGSGMVHPIQIDIIFLDSPDSSLRSRRRMTLRAEALKTLFKNVATSNKPASPAL